MHAIVPGSAFGDRFEQLLGCAQQRQAAFRRDDSPRGAGEQLHPELFLEQAHVAAERGLRDMEILGGAARSACCNSTLKETN